MSTALAKLGPTEIQQHSLTTEQIDLIKQTVAKGTTDAELALFLYTAKRTGLDPLIKQIYAVKRWDKNAGREVMAIQTGIDGYRCVASRTGSLAGITDPAFDVEGSDHPGKATVTVYKLDATGQPREYTASARWEEYKQTTKDGSLTSFWRRMPYVMLGKCAEALALRKAFPNDLSGVYTFEEMQQASYGPPEGKTEEQSIKELEAKPENKAIIEKAEGWINISGRVEKVAQNKGLLYLDLNGVTVFGDPAVLDDLNRVKAGVEVDLSCLKEPVGRNKKAHEIKQVNLVLEPEASVPQAVSPIVDADVPF